MLSFYCDATVQLLTKSLISGCAQLLLWWYCATLDWEPLFWLCSAFSVLLLCNSSLRASFLAAISFWYVSLYTTSTLLQYNRIKEWQTGQIQYTFLKQVYKIIQSGGLIKFPLLLNLYFKVEWKWSNILKVEPDWCNPNICGNRKLVRIRVFKN